MSCLKEGEEIRLVEQRRPYKRKMICAGPSHPFIRRLPEEIMLNIISRLPVDSVLDCRLVCKTWRNIPILGDRNTYFVDMHLHHLLQRRHDHQLSFVFLVSSNQSLYYAVYDENDVQSYNKDKMIKLPFSFDRISVVGSCNGLICLVAHHYSLVYDSTYICNPITREFVHLPRYIMDNKYKYYTAATGFGYHPSTNEYKVVRVIYNQQEEPVRGYVLVYTVGSGMGWINKGETTLKLQVRKLSESVLLNGSLHWLTWEGNIVAFDLEDEKFRRLPTLPCLSLDSLTWYTKSRIWELGGRLCVVHQKADFVADIWFLKKTNEETQSTTSDDDNMKEQEHQTWSWSKEFTIAIKDTWPPHQPIAITKSGEILLWYKGKTIVCCDPKTTAKPEKLADLVWAVQGGQVISHFDSFVSLKKLGENAEML